jgi:hypothetical protein
MGLDMYLEADIGLFDLDHDQSTAALREAVKQQFAGLYEPDNHFIGGKVTIPLAYWRKANAIHRWFVENVQGGKDDCQRAYVGRDKLNELRAKCKGALENRDQADKLLPTQSGFFFGGTKHDEWYFKSLEYTVQALDRILEKLPEFAEVYYDSSW